MNWIKEGLGFGFILFIINLFLLYKSIDQQDLLQFILIMFIFSLLGGLGYGYTMKLIQKKIL